MKSKTDKQYWKKNYISLWQKLPTYRPESTQCHHGRSSRGGQFWPWKHLKRRSDIHCLEQHDVDNWSINRAPFVGRHTGKTPRLMKVNFWSFQDKHDLAITRLEVFLWRLSPTVLESRSKIETWLVNSKRKSIGLTHEKLILQYGDKKDVL